MQQVHADLKDGACVMKIGDTSKAFHANHIFVSFVEAELLVAVTFHSACAYVLL